MRESARASASTLLGPSRNAVSVDALGKLRRSSRSPDQRDVTHNVLNCSLNDGDGFFGRKDLLLDQSISGCADAFPVEVQSLLVCLVWEAASTLHEFDHLVRGAEARLFVQWGLETQLQELAVPSIAELGRTSRRPRLSIPLALSSSASVQRVSIYLTAKSSGRRPD